ncbi:MAG: putative O-glycosylation ligase, exosortase A system-associated [Burkholderiaceae bacterium]|nr:putative O-glycosylation ligase, exosortase A system-associated [Burkholderiaceae bacterium]
MGVRDLVLFALVFAALPFVLKKPVYGVLLWVWISLMNPHRLTWGIAYAFPFAALVAGVTLIGTLVTREPRQPKGGLAAIVLLLFVIWMCISTFFALRPEAAVPMLDRVLKIQLFTFIALLVLYKREHAIWLIAVVTLSVGFYGVKGGLFTLVTGGGNLVWGPRESFIADNNALALAVVMSIPLWAYLFYLFQHRLVRLGLLGAMLLSGVSAIGSFSRGAFVASAAMLALLWWRGKNKILFGAAAALLAVVAVAFMPEKWEERMATIDNYEEDASAMGRINTWQMLFNLAVDRPFVGGGFEPYSKEILARYKPDYHTVHSAHSIYFQVLGEHGFVGLALFLTFWALTWRIGSQLRRMTRGNAEEAWAYWMASFVQVSLVAYFVGGTFLNLAYWDMPYYLMVALVVARHAVLAERAVPKAASAATSASSPAGTVTAGTP